MEFKTGDRVRVFDTDQTSSSRKNEPENLWTDGRVLQVGKHCLLVDADYWGEHWFHKKQCRKLKPKKRRVIWVDKDHLKRECIDPYVQYERPEDVTDWIKFIEAK